MGTWANIDDSKACAASRRAACECVNGGAFLALLLTLSLSLSMVSRVCVWPGVAQVLSFDLQILLINDEINTLIFSQVKK